MISNLVNCTYGTIAGAKVTAQANAATFANEGIKFEH